MRVVWAPWRMTYIEGARRAECIFCVLGDDRRADLVLAADDATVVMLNLYPYNSGHLLVAPRRHVARLDDLDAAQYARLMEGVRASAGVLERVLAPQGLNVGINLGRSAGAGIAEHLHWHVVPRWNGDTNFMPIIAEVKVMPEHLLESYDRLKPHFDALAAARGA
jgi:ATP adenylyltransferase